MGAQHKTREYRTAEANLKAQIARYGATCVEQPCIMPTRDIPAGSPRAAWHVCHDTTGTVIVGPGHARCNTSEGATRGNRMRGLALTPRRWVL